MEKSEALRQYFGYESFHPGQETLIDAVLSGRDALGVMPTGGGKTFSSLRYALRHAALNDRSRVFYIIPYNTILDQNAKDIREALGDPTGILEHHSNVVLPTKEEQDDYRRLTERWDSDIILTSLV